MLIGLPAILFTGYVQRTVQVPDVYADVYTGWHAGAGLDARDARAQSESARDLAPDRDRWCRRRRCTGTTRDELHGPARRRDRSRGLAARRREIDARDRLICDRLPCAGRRYVAGGGGQRSRPRTDLSESGVISLLTPAEVASTLRLMQRPPSTHVDAAVAADVAARQGAKAIVDGTITGLGAGYLVTLRLVSPSGGELASFAK